MDRCDQRSESRKSCESQVDMQQQEALVGWRSSRELVPKEFCWSVLVQHSTMGIHSEVEIDDTLLENPLLNFVSRNRARLKFFGPAESTRAPACRADAWLDVPVAGWRSTREGSAQHVNKDARDQQPVIHATREVARFARSRECRDTCVLCTQEPGPGQKAVLQFPL